MTEPLKKKTVYNSRIRFMNEIRSEKADKKQKQDARDFYKENITLIEKFLK